jgi:diguanylate cyclase (GGDEF)-like protein
MEEELRRANALLAATRRLQSAIGAMLGAQSLEELDRKIVDALPAIGFERLALLAPPTPHEPARIAQQLGYPQIDLVDLPKGSPLATGAFLDEQRTGSEDDDDVPHAGVRGSYVLSPLRERGRVVALLYADTLRDDVELADAASAAAYALDIAGIVRANLSLSAELGALARTDMLTGLPNRRVFEERLEEELHRSARSRRRFGLAILDLDRFKSINDGHGHAAGDEALKAFAQVLRRQARHVDFPARFAGDEFALILTDVDTFKATAIVNRILDGVRKVRLSSGMALTSSVGVTLSYPIDTAESILERADAALYQAKHLGRDRAAFG